MELLVEDGSVTVPHEGLGDGDIVAIVVRVALVTVPHEGLGVLASDLPSGGVEGDRSP